jgi:hypothetical protein
LPAVLSPFTAAAAAAAAAADTSFFTVGAPGSNQDVDNTGYPNFFGEERHTP